MWEVADSLQEIWNNILAYLADKDVQVVAA